MKFPVRTTPSRAGCRAAMASRCVLACLLCAFAAAVLPGTRCRANPSSENPQAMWPIRDDPWSQKYFERAQEAWQAARDRVERLDLQRERDRLSVSSPSDVGKGYVAVRGLLRAADRLRMLHEPVAEDFDLRARRLHSAMTLVIDAYRKLPEKKAQLAAAYRKLDDQSQRLAKRMEVVDDKIDARQFDQAALIMYEELDEMEVLLTCQNVRAPARYLAPYTLRARRLEPLLREQLEGAANSAIAKLRAENLPSFRQIEKNWKLAAVTVRSGGQAQFGGRQLSGPGAVDQIVAQWRQAMAGTLYCRSLLWSQGQTYRSSGSEELRELVADYRQLCELAPAAISRVIAADAERIGAEDARQLYHQYVAALAPHVLSLDSSVELAPVQAALRLLAGKSEAFSIELHNYETATSEVLRWRERIAQQQAAARRAEYPQLDRAVYHHLARNQEVRQQLFDANDTDCSGMHLRGHPASEVVKSATDNCLGIGVRLSDCVSTAGGGRCRLQTRAAADDSTKPPGQRDEWQREVKSLRDDLLSASNPPLSLTAAAALASAQRGDAAHVDGRIQRVELRSLIWQFLQQPDQVRGLLPLGPVPIEPIKARPALHVVLHFHVEPQWWQHRYFVCAPAGDDSESSAAGASADSASADPRSAPGN